MHEENLSHTKEANHFSDTYLPPHPCFLLHPLCHLSLTRKIRLALIQEMHEEPQGLQKFTRWGPKKSNDLDALTCSLVLEASSALPSGHFQSHFFSQMHFGSCKLGFLLEVIT